ncbi:hypothetical protein BDV98DRAFT_597302 [Pterulicium gracile]|uniref:Uncharacterized protein n=1 Tax=Pterulicium gracile TaxID=1884261 RepID=A0A5C3Q6H4_9AGAR|nr:hypothetical protein BDV98DRAFT_597302 [Pterula gracilis]
MSRFFNLIAAAALLVGAVQACTPGQYQCVTHRTLPPAVGVCNVDGKSFAIIQQCKGRCIYSSNGTPRCE